MRILKCAACAAAFGFVAAAWGTSVNAAPLHGRHLVKAESQVVKVHRRATRHSHHVDAPFTHVESGRRVVVEAPFTSVYVSKRGRYVRAPFVSLWIPR